VTCSDHDTALVPYGKAHPLDFFTSLANLQSTVIYGQNILKWYQSITCLTVYKTPCAEYQLVSSTSLPGSRDRFYWFKLGVLFLIGHPVCLRAWLGCDFIWQFLANDRPQKNFDRLRTPRHCVQFCTRSTQL
jgi:hypothetical protein